MWNRRSEEVALVDDGGPFGRMQTNRGRGNAEVGCGSSVETEVEGADVATSSNRPSVGKWPVVCGI